MTPSLKSKLVKRLRALADGARPLVEGGIQMGVCNSVSTNSVLQGEARHLSMDVFGSNFPIAEMLGLNWQKEYFEMPGKWEGERGHLRRTLAGILASYIETEC